MRLDGRTAAPTMGGLLLVASIMAPAPTSAQGVTVALMAPPQVAPGSTFDLYLQVTQPGSGFNSFQAVIGFDPAALTFVPGSNQEGAYMTGSCANTFHSFQAGASADTVADVLLCPGASVSGPGQIYRLRFQASMTPQATEVRFETGAKYPLFSDGGVRVTPLNFSNARIGIGVTLGVEPSPPPPLRLLAAPNPSRGLLTFTMQSDRPGAEALTVMDLLGRTVRRFEASRAEPGVHTITWDGRNEAGAKLPPGVYLARLEVAGRTAWSRVTLVR